MVSTDTRVPTGALVRRALTPVDYIALVLLSIGGLNWLLVGAFSFDLVAAIFGTMTTLTRVVYIIVGLCALYTLIVMARWARK